MQIKDDPSLKWPEKLKGDPIKLTKSKYCRFHQNHGHDTNECYDLKQQIEVLIMQGNLKNFVGQEHKDERPPPKGRIEESVRPPPLRNKGDYGRNVNRKVFQIKENLSPSRIEHPTY